MLKIKQKETTTSPPEGVSNNTDNPLQVGTGSIASHIQQLRDNYRQAQSVLYHYQQIMQQSPSNITQTANNVLPEPTAETIAPVPAQAITIETHLAQHDGTAQNQTNALVQHQESDLVAGYQAWYLYYQQIYGTYQQQLYSLTDPNDIAEQIHALSTMPDDDHTEASLQALSSNIHYSENLDLLFSVNAINVVLSSFNTLKNYSVIWGVLWKLLPHIEHNMQNDNFLISSENINVVLENLNHCLLENGGRNYTTILDILLVLQPHIEANTRENGYHISIENIENTLHSIKYRDTVYILPMLLPHIQYQVNYRIALRDIVNICRGLKDMAYIDPSCHPAILPSVIFFRR